jgi:hypothetical protein
VLFKRLHVSRFWDAPHKSFVYVVWTDRLINGSPQNSISAVVAQPWGNQAPDLSPIGLLLQRRRNKSCFCGHAPVRKLIDAANNCGWKHNRWLKTPLCDAA